MLAESDLQQLLAIYSASIPASERKPVTQIRKMLADPAYRFRTEKVDNKVASFSIVKQLSQTGASLLEYLAVDEMYRRRGIGRSIFEKSASQLTLIEVEPQMSAFYRKLGCLKIHQLEYRMPQVATEQPPPMNLLLTNYSSQNQLSKEQLTQWLRAIYSEIYSQSPHHPAIDAMLQPLPDQIPLLSAF